MILRGAAAEAREPAGRAQFTGEVFPQEMADVAARREALHRAGLADSPGPTLAHSPTVANGLVGLALSGGGMRSASFNLGVLQALHERGVLSRVDYLSTVSGGGWIGSCWSALTREPGAGFPFDPAHDDVLNHIRDRSALLIPSGLLGGAGTAARFLRGIAVGGVLLMPVLALLARLSSLPVMWLLRLQTRTHGKEIGQPQITWFLEYARWAALLVIGWLGVTTLVSSVIPSGHRALRFISRSYPPVMLLALAFAFVELQPYVVLRWNSLLLSWPSIMSRFVSLPTFAAIGVLAIAWPIVRRVLPGARTALLGAAMIVSVALPYLLYLHLTTYFVRAEVFGDADALAVVRHPLGYTLLAIIYLLADVNVFSMHGYFREQLVRTFVVRRADGAVRPADGLKLSELASPGSTAPVHLINATVNLLASDDKSLRGRGGEVFVFSRRFVGSMRTGYCDTRTCEAIVPGMTLATAAAVSASAVSPNMALMTIRPLVLLMTFLNLRLGYWLPNPRRLRAWGVRREASLWGRIVSRLRWVPRVECYLRELASAMKEGSPWVFLSDGGHLENTGAYELLRRRCKYLIVSDAEEDPRLEFGGLAALLRYARLDLGVEIELDLSALRPDRKGRSRRHAARGIIRYPATAEAPAETGHLLYLKSSLSGDEDELVRQYRAMNPDFPHESTADQRFDEAQFEAYRALGHHLASGATEGRFEAIFEEPEPEARPSWSRLSRQA